MLDETIILNLFKMYLKLPWHRNHLLDREINKMGDYLINIGIFSGCFDWNLIRLI